MVPAGTGVDERPGKNWFEQLNLFRIVRVIRCGFNIFNAFFADVTCFEGQVCKVVPA